MAVSSTSGDLIEAVAAALVATLALPLAILVYLRKRRRQKFGEQFPEAIDIIVRSLRAGHPVPVAIGMVARELPDPVGTEFGIVADEITYGSDLETAMRNMLYRVGQEDLPLFVTSVAIQATTGGNLSQILDNLSKVIRERFKMRRKIKGLSAEGRAGAMHPQPDAADRLHDRQRAVAGLLRRGVEPSRHQGRPRRRLGLDDDRQPDHAPHDQLQDLRPAMEFLDVLMDAFGDDGTLVVALFALLAVGIALFVIVTFLQGRQTCAAAPPPTTRARRPRKNPAPSAPTPSNPSTA